MGVSIEGQLSLTEPKFARDVLDGDQAEPLQGIYETSATQNFALGTKLVYPSTGRVFRYARNGGVALAKAYMTQAEGNTAELTNEVQTAGGASVEIGDYEITVNVTTGTGLADNELTGGVLCVRDNTGEGDIYMILASALQSTDTNLDLLLDSPIRTAWAASTEISIIKSPFWDVVVLPTTAAERPAGVPLVAVAINYWCWLQTGGPAPLFVDTGDTIVIGEPAGKPGTNAVAGAVGLVANDGTDLVYGIGREIAAEGEVAIIDLTLEST